MAMEVLALWDGIRLGIDRRYHQVEFESDAQEVVK
jgi:hypothetical protein